MPLTRYLTALTILVAALVVTACGGGSTASKATAPTSTSVASIPPTSALSASVVPTPPSSAAPPSATASNPTRPAPVTSVSSVGGDCGNATVAVNKATNASPQSDQVLDIELKGGCAAVTLATVLSSGSSGATDTALKICQIAAAPAYANGVKAVSVLGVGGSELAAGAKGSPCVKKT